MEKYVCIHGHFYQPPRENPWLESIELQDSAYPYHDWNEKISAECYAPNGLSRILDDQGKITRIVNNYSKISFNVGPTLLQWMQEKAPDVYNAVLDADKLSQERFSGHGSAMAQVYNHMIMPLANERDKFTQVFWGLQDFEYRFGRKPEGMWLAETAVDLASLDIMAGLGVKFTILAPHQAKRIRLKDDRSWTELNGTGIDPTRSYSISLPSGKSMALFFYDGPISRSIAFERLLEKGENLVHRLMGAYSETRSWSQLVHIATDGETYGHHHRYGDMALAYALGQIDAQKLARLTNYGEFLDRFPPQYEVEIFENSSWSCAHGVERWRSNCGCNSGMKPGWQQEWRTSLRNSLDWLRDTLSPLYEKKMREFTSDPWMARNDYIGVLLDRSPEKIDTFLALHVSRDLAPVDKVQALKCLEMQRQLMLMYTSCGWFFDEISGIETVQVIRYAGRAVQLAEQLFEQPFEADFLERLSEAKSNLVRLGNGRRVYEIFVKSAAMDLKKVAAHYAISSLFSNGVEETQTYCYNIDYEDYKSYVAGKSRLVLGWIRVTSQVTTETDRLVFAILHLGDHNLNGGVREFQSPEAYGAMLDEIVSTFKKGDLTETIHAMDRHFGASTYSLKTLFRDEQRKILDSILESTLADSEAVLRQIYENNAPLMRFLVDLMVPLPKALQSTAEFALNVNLKRLIENEELDFEKISSVLEEAKEAGVSLDSAGLAYAFQKNLSRMMDQLWVDPEDVASLINLKEAVAFVRTQPFEVNLWEAQNSFYELKQRVYPNVREKADQGDESSKTWVRGFLDLGEKLSVRVV